MSRARKQAPASRPPAAAPRDSAASSERATVPGAAARGEPRPIANPARKRRAKFVF